MAKSTICHTKRTDHISTNNSNVKLIRSTFLFSGTHGWRTRTRVFSTLLLSIHLPFVTSNYIRRPADLWDTRRTRRIGQTDGHDLTPILSLNTKSSVVPAPLVLRLVRTVAAAAAAAAAARIFRIYVLKSPSPSLSNYIILSIESLLDTVCLPKIVYRLLIYFYLKRQNYFQLIHRQKNW